MLSNQQKKNEDEAFFFVNVCIQPWTYITNNLSEKDKKKRRSKRKKTPLTDRLIQA